MTSLLNFSDEDEDEEEQDYEEEEDEDEESIDYQESGEIEKTVEREERRSPCWRRQLALDRILHGPRLTCERRHSVSVCQTPARPDKKISPGSESPVSSLSSSRASLSARSELSSSGDHDQDP